MGRPDRVSDHLDTYGVVIAQLCAVQSARYTCKLEFIPGCKKGAGQFGIQQQSSWTATHHVLRVELQMRMTHKRMDQDNYMKTTLQLALSSVGGDGVVQTWAQDVRKLLSCYYLEKFYWVFKYWYRNMIQFKGQIMDVTYLSCFINRSVSFCSILSKFAG